MFEICSNPLIIQIFNTPHITQWNTDIFLSYVDYNV